MPDCYTDLAILITAISALIAALASCWLVLETMKQRRSAYLPQLVIKNTYCFLYLRNGFPAVWSNEEFTAEQILSATHLPEINLEMFNVGMAAAKEVRCSWQINIDKIIRDIAEHPQNSDMRVESRESFIFFDTPRAGEFCINAKFDFEKKYDYVLPVNID